MKTCQSKDHRIYLHLSVLIGLVSLLLACDSNNDKEFLDLTDSISNETLAEFNKNISSIPIDDKTLVFGFDIRSSPNEDAKQYMPFLNYLSQKTNLDIKLQFTPKGSDIATELGEGRVQLAAIGATSYIKAFNRYGIKILTRGVNNKGKAEYRSYIVTKPGSRYRDISSLKNARFAFGSIDSTQGHLIPRIELRKHNIDLGDLNEFSYTGSHLNCANAVISGQADACGMQDTLAENLAAKAMLQIIDKSPFYPSSGIAANKDLSQDTVDSIVQALIEFEPNGRHKDILYHWEKTEMPKGFVRANPKDYAELRKWMFKLNLLTQMASVDK